MAEADWKLRLREEHNQLVERLTKLRAYFSEEKHLALTNIDQKLLRKQRKVMMEYELILSDRVARLSHYYDK